MQLRISARSAIAAVPTAVLLLSSPAQTLAQSTEGINRGTVRLIVGSSEDSGVRIAEDLADILDVSGTRRILTIVGKGSLQNIVDLKSLHGVDTGLVQVDVLEAARTQGAYRGIESWLTYIAKLYDEEFHLLALAGVENITDLSGKRVNLGIPGDGTATTAHAIFDRLKIGIEPTAYDPTTALAKLRSGEIAALAYVSAKPAPLFAALRATDGLHFLSIPSRPEVIGRYVPAQLTSADYPGLVRAQQPVDTVAVGTALMVAPLAQGSDRYRSVAAFVDAFFTQFASFHEPGHHPKWGEVNLAAELPGWKRFPPAEAWLKSNAVAAGQPLNEKDLRAIFAKFLDERGKLSGGRAFSAEEKDQLFDQFQRWQQSSDAR
jgi:uncharacterized protein